MRSRGARDRRALTGEAGNASRRQVIEEATARSPEWASAWRTQDESGPNISRVMRTNFWDTTAEIFREHSDSHLGFGSHFSYQNAKKIKLYASAELLSQVDKQKISISKAEKLSTDLSMKAIKK